MSEIDDEIMSMFAQLLQGQTEMKQDINDMKQDITGMKQDITGMKQDISGLKAGLQEVNDRQTVMKTEFKEKFGSLFDFIDVQRNVNLEVIERLERVETKIEVLQMETAHIRQVK